MKFKIGMMGAMLVGTAAFAADGIKLGGFVNGAYDWTQIKGGTDVNQFSIPDGAVYLGKTLGMGEVMVDLPVQGLVAPGTRGGFINPAFPSSTTDNALLAGFGKAQAYVQWKFENGFNWRLGQFDGIYGAESNDAADRFFSHTGLLYAHDPVTHTGVLLGYDFSDAFGFNVLVANPADHGGMTAGNPDWGLKLSTKMDGMHGALGFFMETDPAKSFGGTGEKGWMFNLTAGTNMDQLSADLEAQIAKGKGTSTYVATGDKTSFGIGLHLGYGVSEEVKIGLRGEYYKGAQAFGGVAFGSDAKAFEVAVGPKFQMSKDLDVAVEYYFTHADSGITGADAANYSGLTISAINRF